MLLTGNDIESILKDAFDVSSVEAIDLKGGNHWQVNIVASDFNGVSRVKREQMVQRALGAQLQDETIHALVCKVKGTED